MSPFRRTEGLVSALHPSPLSPELPGTQKEVCVGSPYLSSVFRKILWSENILANSINLCTFLLHFCGGSLRSFWQMSSLQCSSRLALLIRDIRSCGGPGYERHVPLVCCPWLAASVECVCGPSSPYPLHSPGFPVFPRPPIPRLITA